MDHPRIRGEHEAEFTGIGGPSGSSPHTRGALLQGGEVVALGWIIPAYAGSTTRRHRGIEREEGSSPHTRGAPLPEEGAGGQGRIIPAYAGSTYCWEDPAGTDRDHPRIRGEHRPAFEDLGSTVRIIPAYAGSTYLRHVGPPSHQDHPRIRGEHQLALIKPGDLVGSSPHTRGARRASNRPPRYRRIIPAYAGSTSLGWPPVRLLEDHPRIRGEHPLP